MEFILSDLAGCENIDLYNPLVIISALVQKTPWFLNDASENRRSKDKMRINYCILSL